MNLDPNIIEHYRTGEPLCGLLNQDAFMKIIACLGGCPHREIVSASAMTLYLFGRGGSLEARNRRYPIQNWEKPVFVLAPVDEI